MSAWWEQEVAVLLETFLRLPSFLTASVRAALLQPEQLQLLHSNVPAPLLSHALRVCSPESASSLKEGVPRHPLCEHLACALCEWMASTVFPRTLECIPGLLGEVDLEDKLKAWAEKIPQLLATLQELLQQVRLRLQVQEPLLSQIKEKLPDTIYTVIQEILVPNSALRLKAQSSLIDGDLVLLDNVFLHEVHVISCCTRCCLANPVSHLDVNCQLEHSCMFSDPTRKIFTLVLHEEDDTNATITGVLLDRDLGNEEMDVSVPAIELRSMTEKSQPLKVMEMILEVLNIEGVKALLGFRSTPGSIPETLSPARSLLLASFLEANGSDFAGTKLTTGGRALAKHVHRSSSGWWGPFSGNDERKNELALQSITYLIQHACWLNVHYMPPESFVFEIRVKEGYGARWSADGTKFRGFLEPQMMDGHAKRWRH